MGWEEVRHSIEPGLCRVMPCKPPKQRRGQVHQDADGGTCKADLVGAHHQIPARGINRPFNQVDPTRTTSHHKTNPPMASHHDPPKTHYLPRTNSSGTCAGGPTPGPYQWCHLAYHVWIRAMWKSDFGEIIMILPRDTLPLQIRCSDCKSLCPLYTRTQPRRGLQIYTAKGRPKLGLTNQNRVFEEVEKGLLTN